MNFGPTLKTLRRQQRYRQKDIADYLHVSRPTIAGYETKNKQPDFEKLEQLSNLFNVPIDYLITGINRVFPTLQETKDEEYNLQLTQVANQFDYTSDKSRCALLDYCELLVIRDQEERRREKLKAYNDEDELLD